MKIKMTEDLWVWGRNGTKYAKGRTYSAVALKGSSWGKGWIKVTKRGGTPMLTNAGYKVVER